jgi:hypothetical protein
MAESITQEVLQRIIFAKLLLRKAEAACSIPSDQMSFAMGLLLLHDASEAALGAVAHHLHAPLSPKNYLLDYYDLIKKSDPQGRDVLYYPHMRTLNTLRNNIKHEGILPDIKNNQHLPPTVAALLEYICNTYFDLDFSSVSLKSLINNEKVLEFITHAEENIRDGKIEHALMSLAFAMYHICEHRTVPYEKNKELIFTDPYKLEFTVELLAHGVDPRLYYRFKNLTPKIAKHKVTFELYLRWDKDFAHAANWTEENARFCLDFCIDTALKFQKDIDGFKLIPYHTIYEDVIEPSKGSATIWNRSSYPPPPHYTLFQEKPLEPRKSVLILQEGQSIVGIAYDNDDRPDEWFVISHEIPSKYGFVSKEEVNITRREISSINNNGLT